MGIFDRLFGEKEKDSEAKMAGKNLNITRFLDGVMQRTILIIGLVLLLVVSSGCPPPTPDRTLPPPTADRTPPTISISSPSRGQTFTTPTITVRGTASDNRALSRVEVRVGTGSWITAIGTTSWSAPVTLSEGFNTIEARAIDINGNIRRTSVIVNYTPIEEITVEPTPEPEPIPEPAPGE